MNTLTIHYPYTIHTPSIHHPYIYLYITDTLFLTIHDVSERILPVEKRMKYDLRLCKVTAFTITESVSFHRLKKAWLSAESSLRLICKKY